MENRKYFLYLLHLSALVVAVLCGSPARAQPWLSQSSVSQATPVFDPRPGSEEKLCRFDRPTLSPSGRYAIFELDATRRTTLVSGGTSLAIVNVPCLMEKKLVDRCATEFQGLGGMRTLAWSEDEKSLFAVENNVNLMRLAPAESNGTASFRVAERASIKGSYIGETMMVLGATSSETAEAEADRLKRHENESLLSFRRADLANVIYLQGDRIVGAIGQDRNLKTVIYDRNRRHELPMFSTEIPSAVMALPRPGIRTDLLLLDDGVAVRSDGSQVLGFSPRPFARPLISAADGSLMGFFDKSDVLLDEDIEFAASVRNRIKDRLTKDHSLYIQHMAVDGSGNSTVIFLNTMSEKTISFHFLGAELEIKCRDQLMPRPPFLPSPRPRLERKLGSEYGYSVIAMGSQKRPLHGVLLSQAPSRGLAVVFGGGPNGTILRNTSQVPTLWEYLLLGWDVLVVNYSSSVGSGVEVSGRFLEEGFDAFKEDAKSVAKYLEALPIDKKILLHGESFGGLPATALSGTLKRPHRLVLLAPFLKHIHPREWVFKERTPLNPINLDYQIRTEASIFGVDESNQAAYQESIADIYRMRRAETPTFVAFAALDHRILPAHLPESWSGNLKTITVKGDHSLMFSRADIFSSLSQWLDAENVRR